MAIISITVENKNYRHRDTKNIFVCLFAQITGIAHGELTAGVIGSKKPFYDIWGNPVNMASRMDSTGIPGKIQIPMSTAKIVQKNGISCKFRDNIQVKGIKDPVPTYFVSLDDKNCFIKSGTENE